MSSNIVLPNLTKWAQNHITTIIEAATQADVNSALDAFLSKDATIIVNGVRISRADYAKQIQTENFDEVGTTVQFTASVEVPVDKDKPIDAGSVGIFYNAIITQPFRIRDAPVSTQVTASVNVVIEQDPDIPRPPPSPIHGFFDGRRVKALNQVIVQGPVNVNNQNA